MRVVYCIGAGIVFVGAFLRTWGTSYLKAEVMSDSKLHTERIVADGPYRHAPPPLYLGNIVMTPGVGVSMSPSGAIFSVAGMFLFLLRLTLREEAELRAAQGEPYEAFCKAVPRLFPALRPRVPSAGG